MNQAAQQQQQERKPAALVQDAATTYFLFADDRHETEICMRYIQHHYPQSKAKRMSEISLARLTEANHVIVLRRKEGKTPVVQVIRLPSGERVEDIRPYEELIGEVHEARPISVERFWQKDTADEWAEGTLKTPEFFEALSQAGQVCDPPGSPARAGVAPYNQPGKAGFVTIKVA